MGTSPIGFCWQQIVCGFIVWTYSTYCILRLSGVVGSLNHDDMSEDWVKILLFGGFRFFGSAVDAILYFTCHQMLRRLLTNIFVYVLPCNANGLSNKDLQHLEQSRRAWYSATVYFSSAFLWATLLFIIPHIMMDNWASMIIRLKYRDVDRDADPHVAEYTNYSQSPYRSAGGNYYDYGSKENGSYPYDKIHYDAEFLEPRMADPRRHDTIYGGSAVSSVLKQSLDES